MWRNTIHMQITQVNINIYLTEPVHYLSTENVILIAQYMDMDVQHTYTHAYINHLRYPWV